MRLQYSSLRLTSAFRTCLHTLPSYCDNFPLPPCYVRLFMATSFASKQKCQDLRCMPIWHLRLATIRSTFSQHGLFWISPWISDDPRHYTMRCALSEIILNARSRFRWSGDARIAVTDAPNTMRFTVMSAPAKSGEEPDGFASLLCPRPCSLTLAKTFDMIRMRGRQHVNPRSLALSDDCVSHRHKGIIIEKAEHGSCSTRMYGL